MRNDKECYMKALERAQELAQYGVETAIGDDQDPHHVLDDAVMLLKHVIDGDYMVIDRNYGHKVDVAEPWLSYDDGGEG